MKHLLKLFVFLIASNLYGQNCGFTISVPQDITICEESPVVLNGMISGSYYGFEWNGTDGYFDDTELSPTVFVSQTTTYTLSVVSSPTTNLIVNGDFSSGNSGFSTDYNYVVDIPNSQSEMYPEGTYTVINNPNLVHNGFVACSDHTGGGNMMVVNGAAAFQQVWCQTVPVMPNSTYIFQAFATSVNPGSPAILQFSIDGLLLGSPFGLSGTTCDWEEFNETWNSGGNTSVEICITNQNTALGGNDFAIDDIFFGALCEDEKQFTVTLSTFELLPPTSPTVDCNDPEALLIAIPAPDIPGYQYEWNTINGAISSNPNLQQITVITGGEYNVTVTNQAGCTITQQYEVSADFEIPIVEIEGDLTLDCTQNTTQLSANTDANILGFNWIFPNLSQVSGPNITASSPGNYIVNALGVNGCKGLDTVTVTIDNTAIRYNADSTGALTCLLDQVQIFLTLQTIIDSIHWSGPSIISQNLDRDTIAVGAPGTYIYELFLGVDCRVKDSIIIKILPPLLSYSLPEPDTLKCNLTTIELTINDRVGIDQTSWFYNGQLISKADSIEVMSTGTYYIEMTDKNGCVRSDSVIVLGNFTSPEFSVDIDSIDCINKFGQFTTNISGNGSCFWVGQGETSTSKNPIFTKQGNYDVTVTGDNGCKETRTFFLPSSEKIPLITATVDPITCKNPSGKIVISTSIGSDITWVDQNGNIGMGSIINSLFDNTYTVSATTANGCTAKSSYTIPIDTLHPQLLPIAPSKLTCLITAISPVVKANNYSSLRWTGPSIFDTVNLQPVYTKPGIYTLILSNKNGCETSGIFVINEDKTKPKFKATAVDLSCKMPETSLNLSGDPNLNYILSANNQSIQNGYIITSPGTIAIKATNALGCDTTILLDIKGNFTKPIIQPKSVNLNCFKPQIWISDQIFDPLLEYSWNTPKGLVKADSILVDKVEKIDLIAVNQFGCESKAPVEIKSDFALPIINFIGDTIITCTQDFTKITALVAPLDVQLSWEKGGNIISTLSFINIQDAGLYALNVINNINGCNTSKPLLISKQTNPERINFKLEQPLCFGEKGVFNWNSVVGGKGPYTLQVNNEVITQNKDHLLIGGNYMLKVTDINGCTVNSDIIVDKPLDFGVNAGRDTIIILNTSHQIKATSDIAWNNLEDILWSPSGTLSCNDCPNPIANPTTDTEYTINITDENGCIRSDQVWVRVKFQKGFTVPNIIYPESTSGNGRFTIFPVFASIASIKTLRIYDRWGNNVFNVKDIPSGEPSYGWDGTFGGGDIKPGVFVWVAEIEYLDKSLEIVTGDVTVIK